MEWANGFNILMVAISINWVVYDIATKDLDRLVNFVDVKLLPSKSSTFV